MIEEERMRALAAVLIALSPTQALAFDAFREVQEWAATDALCRSPDVDDDSSCTACDKLTKELKEPGYCSNRDLLP
jgi:hypothetical protein